MIVSFDVSIEVSEPYNFNKETLNTIELNPWVKNQWPLVYFIRNEEEHIAYVGESTNASSRIKNHLSNPERLKLNKISIIGSDKFNKSATLDIESKLIQYISAEGTYKLQNGNHGLINHNYYQQDLYKNLFRTIWDKLIEKKFISKSLDEIENSEIFKYSPYKSLNEDQYKSVLNILEGLTTKSSNRIFIKGSAGTGKTVVATYLIKLLTSDISYSEFEDYNEQEMLEVNYIKCFQEKYPKAKIGLVIAMTSLRETIKNVFKNTPGLKASMVISPSDTFQLKEKFDLLIVDEAHRLRQYKNISWMGAFRKNNQKLNLTDSGTELDWVLANSKNQIFFYDSAQSVKPSDVVEDKFHSLFEKDTLIYELKSQMRVQGNNADDYITFVDELLNLKRESASDFLPNDYDLQIFESFQDLYSELKKKEQQFGLCRLIAGYSWPWKSNPKITPKPSPDIKDIVLDGLKFNWNSTDVDWINSPNSFEEIGCIHTTQGYDLNYSGVIFGNEITYNSEDKQIEINPDSYYDLNGKKGISDPELLKSYIINIYKTIMYRGIKGTYIYVCNQALRDYLKQHIKEFKKGISLRILNNEDVKPYVNSVPLFDIYAAAGSFSDLQKSSELQWIELPMNIVAKKGYFVCKVDGDSMNLKIPNGSYCLFRQYAGGSRNGEIVLVELLDKQDSESGSRFTVKEYSSQKTIIDDQWSHQSIFLNPLSNKSNFKTMKLVGDEINSFKVIGIFERVLE